jgi:transposase
VLEESQETEEIIGRVAALDIGKAELVCCIRVPGGGKAGKRLQEVATYATMTRSLLVLADRLGELGVTRVVDGGHQRLLEARVLPAGGPRVGGLAGQRA